MKSKITAILAMMFIGVVFSVHAVWNPAYYWWRTGIGKTGANGFIDGSQWKDGYGRFSSATFDSTLDYGVYWGNQLATPESWSADTNHVFTGKSLHLGNVGNDTGMFLIRNNGFNVDLTFANDGLVLENGNLGSWHSGTADIRGKVTVLASESSPFDIFADATGGAIDFYASILGSGNLWLASAQDFGGSTPHWNGQTDFNCRFHADTLKDFTGTIDVYWASHKFYNASADATRTATFVADSGDFPGHLRINEGARVKAAASDTSFTVDRLTLKDGAKIVVKANDAKTACGLITVNEELTCGRNLGVVYGTATTLSDIVDATSGAGMVYTEDDFKLPILATPSGVALTASAFTDTAYFPGYGYQVETEAGTGRTILSVIPQATRVSRFIGTSDDGGWGTVNAIFSSTATTSKWSGGQQPAEDPTATYLITSPRYFRTNGGNEWDHSIFKGKALVFASSSSGLTLALRNSMTITNLVVLKSAELNNLGYAGDISKNKHFADDDPRYCYPNYFWGNAQIASAATLSVRCYSRKSFAIAANLFGEGGLTLFSDKQDSSTVDSFVGLFGDNSHLYGKISVYRSTGNGLPVARRAKLYFRTAEALGGAPSSFTYNALDLGSGAELHPLNTMTLETKNRGIYCHGNDRTDVVVPSGVTFTCNEPLTLANALGKLGSGKLVLGGERPSFGTYGNYVTSGTTNRLEVVAGSIQAASTNAVRGMVLAMASGTSLVVSPSSDISDGFGKYGLVNTETATPFELADGSLTVDCSDPSGLIVSGSKAARDIAICTVSAAGAATIRNKITLASSFPTYEDMEARVCERVNADSTITFLARYRQGLTLFIR